VALMVGCLALGMTQAGCAPAVEDDSDLPVVIEAGKADGIIPDRVVRLEYAASAGGLFASWKAFMALAAPKFAAVTATGGVVALADSPAPGPADVVGAAIIVIGGVYILIEVTAAVMAQHGGDFADILDEAQDSDDAHQQAWATALRQVVTDAGDYADSDAMTCGEEESEVGVGQYCCSDVECMQLAIALSAEGGMIKNAGPIGAVVVDADGHVLGASYSQVGITNDPTAHAEVMAIRQAAAARGRPDLDGATLYTSVAPCPLCLAASHWANIGQIHYAISTDEALDYGFPDKVMYMNFERPEYARALPIGPLYSTNAEARGVLDAWFSIPSNWRMFDGLHHWGVIAALYRAAGIEPRLPPRP